MIRGWGNFRESKKACYKIGGPDDENSKDMAWRGCVCLHPQKRIK